ncbi:hypothetical protein [Nocardioides convexus]|uniref:hypothetical protein n=1 Tax=Nocardioides convexus TaxID=2712224 RepID=UPI002418B1E6|nr:hypothetical protein [Nocardioides convexus]
MPGATGLRLAVTPALLGKTIAARVTGNRAGYKPVTVTSKATKAVAPGVITPSEPPVLSGEPFVDGTLTATAGRWSVAGTAIEWRWYADDVRIRANGGPSLALTPAYDGKTIKVVAVARKAGYNDATAPATGKAGPVLAGKITVSKPITVTGTRRVGYQVLAVPGTYDPASVAVSYQWLRNGVPIPGATGIRYVQTAADVGRVLTVRASLSKARYIPASQVAGAALRTQAVPTVAVTPIGLKGSALVSLRVTAPGANPVVGWVDVTVGRHTRTVQTRQRQRPGDDRGPRRRQPRRAGLLPRQHRGAGQALDRLGRRQVTSWVVAGTTRRRPGVVRS